MNQKVLKYFSLGLTLIIPATMWSRDENPLANVVILIIRHAEKPESGDGLTAAGERRAAAYVRYFADYKIDERPLHLTALFAARDSKKSRRPRLTIEPLSKATHLPIDGRFSDKESGEIAKELKSHPHGNRIIISWRHGGIPALLNALGVNPKQYVPEGKWPDSVFDRVIELHFDRQGHFDQTHSKLIYEHLMPGDESKRQ